ncbi:ABC transporter permease [Rugosimonospora acidiphila]
MLVRQSFRVRWATYASAMLALVLGVALVTATGDVLAGTFSPPHRAPQRYAHAPVVVSPLNKPPATDAGLPAAVVTELAALGTETVDRIFYAQIVDGPSDQIGRPWSAAAAGPYRLLAGRAPASDDEIVVPTGDGHVGDQVRVFTAGDARSFRVVGIASAASFEHALFFSDHEAAVLCPRVDAVISMAPVAAVRAAVAGTASVRAGSARRSLDPDLGRDTEALVAANSLVGTAGGVAIFVSLFVVASTFAYGVARRRRELALLRMIGATSRQISRQVLAEAAVLGVGSAVLGNLLGRALSPPMAQWLVRQGFAPSWFAAPASVVPSVIAIVVGIATAILGAWAAARRAARVRPTEALRESGLEARPMTVPRWLGAIAVGGGALAMLVLPPLSSPNDALNRKHYVPMTMLLVVALALLAPAIIAPITRAFGRVVDRSRRAVGLLVNQSARAASAQTAAAAAPVLLTVGLAACLLSTTDTIDQTRAAESQAQVISHYIVVPDGTPGIGMAEVDRLRAVPGLVACASAPMVAFHVEDGGSLIRRDLQAVDFDALAQVTHLPIVAGSVTGLEPNDIVVDQDWGRKVGDPVTLWRTDGSTVSLRVAAVIRTGANGNGAYVARQWAPSGTLASQVLVNPSPRADPATVSDALHRATAASGVAVESTADWARSLRTHSNAVTRSGLRVVLGIALLYSLLSLAGTMLMAAQERRGSLRMLRLAGATSGQLLRIAGAESLAVVAVGFIMAAAAQALTLAGLGSALVRLSGARPEIVLAWRPTLEVTLVCAVVTVLTTLVSATVHVLGREHPRTG